MYAVWCTRCSGRWWRVPGVMGGWWYIPVWYRVTTVRVPPPLYRPQYHHCHTVPATVPPLSHCTGQCTPNATTVPASVHPMPPQYRPQYHHCHTTVPATVPPLSHHCTGQYTRWWSITRPVYPVVINNSGLRSVRVPQ